MGGWKEAPEPISGFKYSQVLGKSSSWWRQQHQSLGHSSGLEHVICFSLSYLENGSNVLSKVAEPPHFLLSSNYIHTSPLSISLGTSPLKKVKLFSLFWKLNIKKRVHRELLVFQKCTRNNTGKEKKLSCSSFHVAQQLKIAFPGKTEERLFVSEAIVPSATDSIGGAQMLQTTLWEGPALIH